MNGGEGDDALSKLVLASFVEEIAEHALALKRDALRLESVSGPARAEVLHLLFRTVHTVKGASRAAGVAAVEAAMHSMEDLLQSLRARPETLTPAHVSRILTLGDTLENVGPQLARAGTLTGSAVERELGDLGGPPPSVRASLTAPEPLSEDPSGAVRLSVGRVDAMIALATELDDSIVRAVGAAAATEAGDESQRAALNFDRRRITRLSHSLVTAARDLRQMPFSAATLGLDRVAREAALATGRDVAFEVLGSDVGLDREIVRSLREALIHLVRNAIDHGCEPPEERVRNGKTARATVRVEARVRSSDLVVSIEDDGRGFDVEKLRAAGRAQGERMTDEEAVQAAFIPGVTTSPVVTVLSGRGIGLDVVRKRIEDLRGAIAVSFQAGRGTKIALTVPVRRSSVRAITALAGSALVAVPTPAIERLLRIDSGKLTVSGGRLVLPDARGPIPIADLATLLGAAGNAVERPHVLLVLLASHARTAGIVVDDLIEERELPVSALPARLADSRLVSGVTTSSTGRLALVMHTGELIERASGALGSLAPAKSETRASRPQVLLADDSLTTRTLERSILEAAGFDVLTASDGEEALALLHSRSVDAVVSDVEMPKVDGFELAARIRATPRFNALPIVLVTGRASEEDRKKGLDAGANAYIVKRAFDQELLIATLRRLL